MRRDFVIFEALITQRITENYSILAMKIQPIQRQWENINTEKRKQKTSERKREKKRREEKQKQPKNAKFSNGSAENVREKNELSIFLW